MAVVSGNRWLTRGWLFVLFSAVVATLALAAAGWLAWPREKVFRVVLGGVVVLHLAWWLRADLRLAQTQRSPGRAARARALLAVYDVLMLLPLIGMLRGKLDWHRLPTVVVMWLQLWHMLMWFVVPCGAVIGAAVWMVRRRRGCRTDDVAAVTDPPVNLSRRALLARSIVAAPIVVVGGATAAGAWQTGRFERRRCTVSPPGLPDRLRGLTITHVSDFHVGRLFQYDDLWRAVEAANGFNSDLVVITGDVVDHSNDVLPETIEALRTLRHRYGVFLCLGNHDVIDDGQAYVASMRDAGLPLLLNECHSVDIGGERLDMAGLLWSRRDSGPPTHPGHEQHVEATFPGGAASAFTIALAHHPHAFDALARRNVALTLSGHTHGGQLMLTPPGWSPIGAGNVLFRYIRGFYAGNGLGAPATEVPAAPVVRSDRPLLFVNRGVGNWFPLRLNAPAEIVQLRLA